MVARAIPTIIDPPKPASDIAYRLFKTWRVVLTRFARGIISVTEGASSGARRITRAGVAWSRTTARHSTQAVGDRVGDVSDSLGWLFNGWRRLLSRMLAFARPRERFAAVRSVCTDAYMLLARPESFGTLDSARADRLVTLGLRAFIVGSAVSIGVGVVTTGAPGPSIASVVNGALWAAARLAILIALAPRDRRSRVLTAAVWSASLLPYLLGLTDGLRWVALGASAFLCYGALSGAGLRRETVRTMTAWAFGGQVAVLMTSWLLRGALALLATL